MLSQVRVMGHPPAKGLTSRNSVARIDTSLSTAYQRRLSGKAQRESLMTSRSPWRSMFGPDRVESINPIPARFDRVMQESK